ncbi:MULTISPECIES: FliA/WhiG family RNA polymerase sigma factor [unclassified Exiguobacterium]|uniref:FliA/WhiG family RNA polymerase sigma factor n=1 Tax=unclassified Exiguobacterium TaxID=2644629 RepID=UPI00093DFFAA|nr:MULTISPECIES: FliA/WhiG family RNA polymerase sigma factor [unclassified Exiguobacterium]MDA5560012.1 FliA/WhiG family RNA polymerase sigma factor [Exiguobacterium sp. MMG028]
MTTHLTQLWDRWNTDRDMDTANELLAHYEFLIHYHVQRMIVTLPKSVERDELKSLGYMGLYDALMKYDPEHNNKFDTYAAFRIRGAIIDGLRKVDWLPRSVREKVKKIDQAAEQLEQSLHRAPTKNELALACDLPVSEIERTMAEGYFANMLSIDEAVTLQEEGKVMSVTYFDPDSEKPEDTLLQRELIDVLATEVDHLSEKERLVVSLFYFDELTLTEIGEVLELSTSRISQIHSKALKTLKQALGRSYLEEKTS